MILNTTLAWNRVKNDWKEKSFITPIFLPKILEPKCEEWLKSLKEQYEGGFYNPHPMEIIEIPKGKGLIRPGSLLRVDDNIFYFSLVQECYPKIFDQIEWSQGKIDFSYIATKESITKNEWFKKQDTGWNEFRNQTINVIKEGYQYVIITDIAGFYENINISLLASDLRLCKVDADIIEGISKCLNYWYQNGKGIPQGNSASDLLAKLYLNTVDKAMINTGFKYLRYVDDIRIFCKNKAEAKRALIELSKVLRKRGLNLHSAKTKILAAGDALNEIGGIQSIIENIKQRSKNEVFDLLNLSTYQSEDITNEESSLELIKKTMQTFFIEGDDENFNKSLFHYLIKGLIKQKDSFALVYCLSILDKHPEETAYVLKYTQALNENDNEYFGYLHKIVQHLLEFLSSDEAVYDYQNYQILNWLDSHTTLCDEKLSNICRKIAFDNNRPYYLVSIARKILGKLGDIADIERLEDYVYLSTSELEKAESICCLLRMEKSKRNSFLGRIQGNSHYVKSAVEFVKSQ